MLDFDFIDFVTNTVGTALSLGAPVGEELTDGAALSLGAEVGEKLVDGAALAVGEALFGLFVPFRVLPNLRRRRWAFSITSERNDPKRS